MRRPKTSPGKKSGNLLDAVRARTRSAAFKKYLQDTLAELCRVNTTPNAVVARMREAESACFDIIERELAGLPVKGARLERRAVNPAIQKHPFYSLLHFTKTRKNPEGLSPEEVYAGRSNLLCFLPGAGKGGAGKSVALNGHIDVVAPYLPPSVRGGTIYGRGACDDKGPVVGMLAALKVVADVLSENGLELNRNVLAMFVVEEETGGNGSLSLALDRDLKKSYDSVLVSECTGLKIHPANRGAVWYKAVLTPPPGAPAFEMFAFVNEEMEKEGLAIRAESRHDLFPQRPVQTCHGIIGPFGEHPSRICGETAFTVRCAGGDASRVRVLMEDCLASGLYQYIGLYGDKSKVTDPATGKAMVPSHYEVEPVRGGLRVRVHGATGHMGAIRERDGAITKMAHLLRALLRSRERIESGSVGRLELQLEGWRETELVLEGGQGFVPTHPIEQVMERFTRAAERGARFYLDSIGVKSASPCVKVTFEKLHNVAFDGDPASPTMQNALKAAKLCNLPEQEPVLGWTVSCDARLFATEYPGMDVITFGPGQLVHAHSDREQIELEDLRTAAEFLAVFILGQTGTVALPQPARARKS